jgi:hypothetical protein
MEMPIAPDGTNVVLPALLIEPYRGLRDFIVKTLSGLHWNEAIAILDAVRADMALARARISSCATQED